MKNEKRIKIFKSLEEAKKDEINNRKPAEEFEYVKVLILERLLDYIKYFEPIFSNKEVISIAESLLQHCGKLER
ncbi:MAG TPA: hypothetical protein VL088_04805 [Pedobacter sp.]|nr:hypothetical protein [Pedobacter sp.]